MASLYWKKGKALIHAANLGKTAESFKLKADLSEKGFAAGQKIQIRHDEKKVCSTVKDFSDKGIRLKIPHLESSFIEISAV